MAITRGSRNVFADLRFPDAAERQAKLRLAFALNRVLEERKLSQADAARMLGLTQPKVSALRHYKLVGFSLERLMNVEPPTPPRFDESLHRNVQTDPVPESKAVDDGPSDVVNPRRLRPT
jgi:predicted XRE-type DNA-binding protein